MILRTRDKIYQADYPQYEQDVLSVSHIVTQCRVGLAPQSGPNLPTSRLHAKAAIFSTVGFVVAK